jgi:hypothetical protein
LLLCPSLLTYSVLAGRIAKVRWFPSRDALLLRGEDLREKLMQHLDRLLSILALRFVYLAGYRDHAIAMNQVLKQRTSQNLPLLLKGESL